MKRELYENYLLMKYIMMSMKQINSLEAHEKEYYINDIETFLNKG